jgi:hypothetical protein
LLILAKVSLATRAGVALSAYALQVAKDLRLGLRDLVGAQAGRRHPPLQQVGRVGPAAGKCLQFGNRDADVARDMRSFLAAAASKLAKRGIPRGPIPPPLGENAEWPGATSCCGLHGSLPVPR